MKKMLFVFNPNSGKGQIKNRLLDIIKTFTEGGYEVVVHPTNARLDAKNYVLENGDRFDCVVCSGGDGTLNEVVGAMIELEKRIPLGYIPSGTTNDFASSLKIPKDMNKAASHIVDGQIFSCDIGMQNQKRNFNYIAAFGAFTSVSYETPQYMKNALGHQAYVLEALKQFAQLKPYKVRIETDTEVYEGKYIYGMISNTTSVGGVKGITGPSVDLSDGLFEVLLIGEINSPFVLQQILNSVILQEAQDCDALTVIKSSKVRIISDEKIAWTLDGEYGGSFNEVSYEVRPKAVDFIVKRTRKHDA